MTTAIAVTADDKSNSGSATAMCAAGDIAISGGVSTETEGWFVRASNPSSVANNPTGWFGEIAGNGEGDKSDDSGDSGDGSYSSSSVSSSSTDNSSDSSDDEGDGHDHGAATGTVYVVCATP